VHSGHLRRDRGRPEQVVRSAILPVAGDRSSGAPHVGRRLNGSVYTAVLVYVSFFSDPNQDGLYFVGGTSAGVPQWAP
jgi:hypothetical protein